MFKELLYKDGYEYDYVYDWVILNDKLINQNALTFIDNGEDQDMSKYRVKHISIKSFKFRVQSCE